MKKIMMVVLVIMSSALALGQAIEDPPKQSGATVDQGQPPVQGSDDPAIVAKETRIRQLDRTVSNSEQTLRTSNDPETRGKAIVDACCSKQEATRLRQELASLRGLQRTSNRKVSQLQTSDKEQNKRLDQLDADAAKTKKDIGDLTPRVTDVEETLNGYTDEKGVEHASLTETVWGKDGTGGLTRKVGTASSEASKAKKAADSAQQTANSAAGGWVTLLAVVALVLAAIALFKSFR